MNEISILGVLVVGLLLALAGGIPLAIALGLTASIGLFVTGGLPLFLSTLQTLPYNQVANYAFAVLPLFIWMGLLADQSGMVQDLYISLSRWLQRLRGSLVYVSIAGGALFGAACGSSLVSAVLFTKVSLPEMLKQGYDKRLSAGAIASIGTLAVIIPPSIPAVIFGMIANVSIGGILVAGIIPGVIIAACYALATAIWLWIRPASAPLPEQRTYTLREFFAGTWGALAIIGLFVIVIGGIYGGFFTPTSAGAIGCLATFLLVIARKRFDWRVINNSLIESAITTARVLIVVVGGMLFGRYLAFSGISASVVNYFTHLAVPSVVIVIFIIVMYFILGMLIDPVSMMIVTVPLTLPVMTALGYDPIWFGVLTIVMVEVAVLTPPVGFNVFGVVSASGGTVKTEDAFIGSMPYVASMVLFLALLIAFPQLALWLPSAMGR